MNENGPRSTRDVNLSEVAIAFQVAFNVFRVHHPENEASRQALTRLLEGIHAAFLEDGECSITRSGDHLFVNRVRVRPASEVAQLRELLERMEISGMEFNAPPEPKALGKFVLHLAREGRWEAPEDCYVEPITEELVQDGANGHPNRTVRGYRHAIREIQSIFHETHHSGQLNMRRARRLAGDIVEMVSADQAILFGLMAIRDYDQYTFQHSINVAVLATAVAARAGLDRALRRELGVAALFHDIGKLEVPREVLNKPGRFTRQEWDVMKTHAAAGARRLLKHRGLDPGAVKAARVALEHHIRPDGSGYPQLPIPGETSIYSRIVALCDAYDAMTSSRAYRQTPIIPPDVVGYLWAERGKLFDTGVVKSFIGLMGAYPPGSLVQLSDNALVVVVEAPRGEDIFRPVIRRIGGTETEDLSTLPGLSVTGCRDPLAVDLSDEDVQAYLAPAA
jgi:putative nucleotidyltransferase with HDIG domain